MPMAEAQQLNPETRVIGPQPGALVSGKYRLLRLLGAGGMGSVWAARNELTDRDFAVKFLLPSLAQSKEALHRFFLEARACGQIKHPAVVDVYDMGQAEDGAPYLVMELLEGEGFDQRLARAGVFRPGEAAAWLAYVARGLEEAHVRGLVHRDLKPGNIFFALDDRGDVIPKILDFGVSKATSPGGGDFVKTTTGAVLGSPAYMSPEQAKGDLDVDGRSDVWSLGVILYEALTGQIPFDAPNYNALMLTIITKPHRPAHEIAPGVPPEISQLIDRCLAKDRNQRVGTARELAERLEAAAASRQSGAYPGFTAKVPTLMPGYSPLRHQSNPSLPSIPPPPGMPSGMPVTTTQGPWSDAHPTQRFLRRRSSLVWLSAAMLVATALIGGLVAFARLRPPQAAVAGRSSLALVTSMARLQQQLAQIKADEKAAAAQQAQAAADAQKSVVIEPSELPNVKKRGGSAPDPSATPRPRGKGGNKDPNGGVDSAGF
jgi:eukaryotic-like serine/threonine-protein kinase